MKADKTISKMFGITIILLIIAMIVMIFCHYQIFEPYQIEDLTFETPKSSTNDDYDFDGRLITPRDGQKTHPVVIISHGYNSTMENCEDVAKYYADAGYAALIFDFVGGSRNSSTKVHSSQMTTFTEVTDYEIVFDYVKDNDAFDQDNIFISGQSFGGLVATVVAAKHQDEINSVALFYPAYNMVENSAKILASGPAKKQAGSIDESSDSNGDLYDWEGLLVSEKYLTELHGMDITGTIESLNKDVIIMQGDLDDDVTMESTKSFLPYFPSVEMVTITGGGHGFSGSQLLQAEEAAVEFLNAHLK